MRTKRALSWLLVLMMIFTFTPVGTFADSQLTEGQVIASKQKIGDMDSNGLTTIELSVKGKDKVTKLGADVILVVDESGSMGKDNGGSISYTCGSEHYTSRTCGSDDYDGHNWQGGPISGHYEYYTCHGCGAYLGKSKPGWFWKCPNTVYVCSCGKMIGSTVPTGWKCTNNIDTTRMDLAKSASTSFVNSVLSDDQNRVAIIGFNGSVPHKCDFTKNESEVTNQIKSMDAGGGTNYTKALDQAVKYAKDRSNKTKPLFVVMMSDGAPGASGNSANDPDWNGINEAEKLKSDYNATIYTVGMALNDTDSTALKALSSTKNGNKLYQNVSVKGMVTDLANVLNEIAGAIKTTPAGRNTVMTDKINLDKFEWVGFVGSHTGADYYDSGVNKGKIIWNIGTTTEMGSSIRFEVRLKKEYLDAGGTYNTNTDVNVTYKNLENKDTKISKGDIGDPQVTSSAAAKQYDVSYGYIGTKPASAPNVPKTIKVTEKTTYTIDTTVKKGDVYDNLIFSGWEIENNNGADKIIVENGTFVMPSKAVNLKGTWTEKEKFTVSYNANGGTGTMEPDTAYVGGEIAVKDNEFTAPENYIFDGWKDADGNVVAVGSKLTKNTVLTAQWKRIEYTIGYDLNGGTGTTPAAVKGVKDQEVPLASGEGLTKKLYHFVGWARDKAETASDKIFVAGQNFKITATETLYAIWGKDSATLKFDANGANENPPNSITKEVETIITLPGVGGMTKKGCKFIGWATTSSAIAAEYVKDEEYTLPEGETTLYAVWQQTAFDVTYYVYKTEINPTDHINHTTLNYTAGTDDWKGTVEVITGSGLDFINCTTSNKEFTALEDISFGKTTQDIIKLYKDNYSVNQGIELVEGLTIVPFRLVDCGDGNIHVDCKIIPDSTKKFSVTYNPGTQGTFEKQTTTDLIYGNPIPAFTGDVLTQHNDGYEFAGWKVGDTQTTVAAITGNVTGSVTYTAQWNALNTEYTIEWYQQDVEGKTYEKVKTTTASALTGTPVSVTAGNEDIVGFDLNSAKSTLSADKLGMGTVLKVYYDREKYKVEGFLDGTSLVEDHVLFGATYPAIIFNAKENYHIAGVKVNDASASFDQGKSYTYPEQSNVTGPIKVEVTTEIDQFTITASAIGTGTILSKGAITVNAGENAKYTIIPDTDSYLEDVKIDGESVNDETLKNIIENGTYTFTNVSKNSIIEAVFEAKIVVTLTAKGEQFIYNGKEQSVEGFSTEGLAENLTIAGITAGAKGTNVDDYVVTFDGTAKVLDGTTDVTRKYTIKTNNDSKLVIKPAALTITADSASKNYDGTALTDSGWQDTTPSGIVAGDVILYVNVTGSAINVGSVPNVASNAIIGRFRHVEDSQPSAEQLASMVSEVQKHAVEYKAQNPEVTIEEAMKRAMSDMFKDVTSNYTINYKPGTLTVNSSGGSGGHHHHPTTPTPTAIINDEAVPLGGNMQLNKTEHFNYVKGYNDGNVKPLNNITREEVATIFYRLLTESSRAMYFSQDENFSDIAISRWSLNSIATLANGQILTGYQNGTFGATKPITRAEFAAIASRFDALEQTTDNQFSDVSNHWAKSYINSAAKKGWINGYEDGTFKPDQYITRAEAMTLINKVLERRVDAAGLMNGYKVFPDNKENAWYYYQVIEATNNHKYADRKNMSDMEKWAEILSDKTWNE